MENNFENDTKNPIKKSSVIFIIIMLLCVATVITAGFFTLKNANNVLRDLTPKTVEPLPDQISATQDETSENKQLQQKVNSSVTGEKISEKKPEIKKEEKEKPVSAPAEQGFTIPVNGSIISPFSIDALVFSKTLEDWRIHTGIDIKASAGSVVKAASNGRIEDIYFDEMMGQTIVLSHSENIKSIYSNLDSEISVKKGTTVKKGDIIGKIGKTSVCESGEQDHLHFEIIKNGKQIDPYSLIKNNN